ncbi:MAG TPA: ABC transporter permease [Candidatus Baltobacteraceae bacterium]|nr:ABC transporter permease [Candidatus Baltobacteraceae bacterium]
MYFREAIDVLLANKVRSLLTILGLIIGVGAVISIQVLGASMAGAVNGLLGGMSDNSFFIVPNTQQRNADEASFKLSDLDAIRRSVDGVAAAIPLAGVNDVVRHGHHAARYFISGESAIPFSNLPVLYGRHIDQRDVDSSAPVCVITNAAYDRLFPGGGDPTGQSVYVGSNRFLIVGVLTAPNRGFINGQFGGDVLIPWTTYDDRYLRNGKFFAARFIATDPGRIGAAETGVIEEMRSLRGKPDLQYQSYDKSQFAQGVNGVFNAMTLIVAFIGAVSLLVAGIGIMNIMLVSVAERTREIGVRKAIGARRSQVLAQFFIEALILCGAGCAIGWAIGIGIGSLVNNVAIVKVTGTIVGVPWAQTIAIAASFAVVVTLAFGTYPAFRAAALDPIEALRYE